MLMNGCPGAAGYRGAQELKIKICPECGREIELFTRDIHIQCECGFVAYNDAQSCLQWCAYARDCVGDALYEKYFENSQRRKAG